MSKSKHITIASNPFDKHRSAAEAVMYGDVKPTESNTEVETVDNVDDVGTIEHVEQQSQQAQQDDEEMKKKSPRRFPGKQHVHLILPDEQANMIRTMAKYSGMSINKFMTHTIQTMYETQWKEVYDIMRQMQHKMGLDKKPSKELFN